MTALSAYDQAHAVALRNLRGQRDKDLLATAAALQRMREDPRTRSLEEVAQAAGVSREIVRQFLSLLKLPPTVRDRFQRGTLQSLEKGRRLWQLMRARPDLVESVAEAMEGLTAHESRNLVTYLLRHPSVGLDEALAALEGSRSRVHDVFMIVAELDSESNDQLRKAARGLKIRETDLVSRIVREWLESTSGSR